MRALLPLLTLPFVIAALAPGCQPREADATPVARKAPPPKPAPKPAPVPPPRRTDYDAMRFHMHHNFDLLRAIERLLIRGKLDEAKRFAAAIAAAEAPAHGPWAAHTVAVRDRATALARATTVVDACGKSAKLAAACAGCHVELGVAPELSPFPPAPPDKPTVDARMARHRWASDRLWEGIMGGADDPWRAGLDVLAAPALEWATFAPGRADHATKLRRLAISARKTKRLGLEARAAAYGEMLATCAACHTATP